MIPFNKPPYTSNEDQHVIAAMRSSKISGDGEYSRNCQAWLEAWTGCRKALLTPSCTHALEMAAMLIDIQPGDEVIMPSYTFVSTANAFVLRGAKIVFVDIRPDTMNIDESLIENAITSRTKAIVPVHYAGVACEMDAIMDIANRHSLFVIEDAAQGMMSTYKGRHLGSIGHMGAYSFHETKNYTSGGEGGALLINDAQFIEHAEILREKGTDRSRFFKGQVDKYTWVGIGSSYLPSEIQAAYLWGQLEHATQINQDRLSTWNKYHDELNYLSIAGHIVLPEIPQHCSHNAHMHYIKLNDLNERGAFIRHMKENGIMTVFHYVPLHTAPAGITHGRFSGDDQFTTSESNRLVRLPLWFGLDDASTHHIINCTVNFFYR